MLVLPVTEPEKVFVTSDLHLDRPDELRFEQIVTGWNEKVPDDGLVFVLGDLCTNLKKCKHVFDNLNGKTILVKGNHDHFSNGKIFDTGIIMYESDSILLICKHSKKLFNIILSHKPVPYRKIRSFTKHIDIVIHGHNHRQRKLIRKVNNTFYINVIIDKYNYYPLSIDEIIKMIY